MRPWEARGAPIGQNTTHSSHPTSIGALRACEVVASCLCEASFGRMGARAIRGTQPGRRPGCGFNSGRSEWGPLSRTRFTREETASAVQQAADTPLVSGDDANQRRSDAIERHLRRILRRLFLKHWYWPRFAGCFRVPPPLLAVQLGSGGLMIRRSACARPGPSTTVRSCGSSISLNRSWSRSPCPGGR